MSFKRPRGIALATTSTLASRIHLIRGMRVMLSSDLAELYGVEPKVLVQGVRRNRARFPGDFMFQLTAGELRNLKSQIVTSSWGGLRKPPHAFTEQGVAMLSSVLRSRRAVRVNIAIMRAFVRLRTLLASHADLAHRLDDLERRYDGKFATVFDAIRHLMTGPDEMDHPQIGFHARSGKRVSIARLPARAAR